MLISDRGLTPSFWNVRAYMDEKGLQIPCTIKVAFREGRHKRVKSIRILELLSYQDCDCCGPTEYYKYSHNGKISSTRFGH